MGELQILLSDEFRRAVDENLDRDHMKVALDKRLANAALVASQVKYLKRAARKLPSYYAARCILPPLAFEQSSSEQTASVRTRGIVIAERRLAIDLTCGLGVDAFFIARRFERVIAVERDPYLAAVARENFRRLGAHNIEVVNARAEDFCRNAERYLHRNPDPGMTDAGMIKGMPVCADLVYADPDRRSKGGKKLLRMEDCSPDVIALLADIKRIAPRFVVKLSPLFDVDEIFRIFGSRARADVISLDGECKEIVAEASDDIPSPIIRVISKDSHESEYCFTSDPHETNNIQNTHQFAPEQYKYLIIPDVALQKARLARRYFSEYRESGNIEYDGGTSDGRIWIDSDNGYGFAATKPRNIMGKALEICSIEPFDPKALKRRLKAQGIKSIDILKRNFPLSTTEIAGQLGIREGGRSVGGSNAGSGSGAGSGTSSSTGTGSRLAIAFTRADERLWQITLKSTV